MFRLVDTLPPYGRTLLGSTTGPAVDTGIAAPADGFVYLSRTEVWEAARLWGFVDPDVAEKMAVDFADALERVDVLEDRLLLLNDIEDRLLALHGIHGSALEAEIKQSRAKASA